MAKVDRRQQILETLALMLHKHPGDRITTANLAEAVGVSEAALYRHFPSKAKMLEGLMEFAEETIFSRINLIMTEQTEAHDRLRSVLFLTLSFVERNPGFARLFVGDVLQGETERLRARMHQLLNRIETQLRLILREHNIREPSLPSIQINAGANLLLAFVEGKIAQFVRSNFTEAPTAEWDYQWQRLADALFK